MGLVRNEIEGGVTKSIFAVSNDDEKRAYQSLIDTDMPKCPRCYSEMKLPKENMLFEVINPLANTIGMDLATFTPICPICKGKSTLDVEVDLNPAFPTAVETLKRARANYAAMRAAKNGAKGGTNGKR